MKRSLLLKVGKHSRKFEVQVSIIRVRMSPGCLRQCRAVRGLGLGAWPSVGQSKMNTRHKARPTAGTVSGDGLGFSPDL